MHSLFSNDPAYKPYIYEGLNGRYAHWPAHSGSARRTFILVYGQHATLERMEPIAQAFRVYGDVYCVDTPGFGGMEPSHKVGKQPTLDFMAGHLKNFISTKVPADRELTILGVSYGFQIITTLLGQDLELQKRTELAISFVGFVNYTDFSMPLSYRIFLVDILANIGRTRLGARFLKAVTKPALLHLVYFLSRPFNVQYKSLSKEKAHDYLKQQIWLWTVNDFRTHGQTGWDFLKKVDLTGLRIDVPAIHIGVPKDHLLKNEQVAAEFKQIFKEAETIDLNLASHAPIDLDNPDKVSALLPDKLKTVLMSSRNKTGVIE